MALQFSIDETDAQRIGLENLTILSDAYTALFPGAIFVVDLALLTPEEIQILNKKYRDLDEPTDVLSFPTFANEEELLRTAREQETLIGSIVICPEKALNYEETLIQLVHHGLLHLFGYDHETDMTSWNAAEQRILDVVTVHGIHIPALPHDPVQLP
jgi:rRNA maturation RNase YbeY